MPWNPVLYARFLAQRGAPFHDLLNLIPQREGLRVLDLGCGAGELSSHLADYLPNSDVLGIDSAPEMLHQASEFARRGLTFALDDVPRFIAQAEADGETWDVVFSHSALQWMDDHAALIPRLLNLISNGGILAVQMPSNHHQAPHHILNHLAAEAPFQAALGGWQRQSPVLSIEEYATLIYQHQNGGWSGVVLEKVYPILLPNVDTLIEWMQGTGLTPYLDRLPVALHPEFLAAYRERLIAHYGAGEVFYPFKRLLFSATRLLA